MDTFRAAGCFVSSAWDKAAKVATGNWRNEQIMWNCRDRATRYRGKEIGLQYLGSLKGNLNELAALADRTAAYYR